MSLLTVYRELALGPDLRWSRATKKFQRVVEIFSCLGGRVSTLGFSPFSHFLFCLGVSYDFPLSCANE